MEDLRPDGRVTLKATRGSSSQAFEMSVEVAADTAERLRAEGWTVTVTQGSQPYRNDPVEPRRPILPEPKEAKADGSGRTIE
jgi:hypothetical protein